MLSDGGSRLLFSWEATEHLEKSWGGEWRLQMKLGLAGQGGTAQSCQPVAHMKKTEKQLKGERDKGPQNQGDASLEPKEKGQSLWPLRKCPS